MFLAFKNKKNDFKFSSLPKIREKKESDGQWLTIEYTYFGFDAAVAVSATSIYTYSTVAIFNHRLAYVYTYMP